MSKNIKVLIIDDDEVNNYLCSRIINLSEFSQDVHTCTNATDGLAYLKSLSADELPDIIFLDINMPIKTGWDFLDEYNKLGELTDKNIQIYMLSSSVYEEDISRAKGIPMVQDYISKPLSEELLQHIKKTYF